MIVFRIFTKIFKNVWLEFWNEFYGAWSLKVLDSWYGKGYVARHPIRAQIVGKLTAISYIFLWWGAFGVIFFGATLVPPYLLAKYDFKYHWVYFTVYVVFFSLPTLGALVGGWLYDKATKNISN
ncbi:MAG: hypothetical protein ACP5JE_03845 [Thermoplasmata archaeon]